MCPVALVVAAAACVLASWLLCQDVHPLGPSRICRHQRVAGCISSSSIYMHDQYAALIVWPGLLDRTGRDLTACDSVHVTGICVT